MTDVVRDYIRIRRPAPRKPRTRKPKTVKTVKSPVVQAAWVVLNRRRGEALTSKVIAAAIARDHPDLLPADRTKGARVVYWALRRLDDVNRSNGRFWLPRAT